MIKKEYIATGKRIFWIGLFFMLLAIIISAVDKKKGRMAKDINIDILALPDSSSLISREDVLVTIERSFGYNLTGIPLESINVERVERVLESDPFVFNSDVFIDAHNVINIEIEQRLPIVRIIDQNGFNYYLDEFGEQMPLSKHFAARVLVATGKIPPFDRNFLQQKKHVIKDLFTITQRILIDEFLEPMIEQVYVNQEGDYVLIPKLGDQKIIFGKMEDIEEKILYLKNFYKEALPYKGWQRYKTINLKFKGQVVAGKR